MALKGKENKTIVLPIEETNYSRFMSDNAFAHSLLHSFIENIPECFPNSIENGYQLNGTSRLSKKTNLKMRKIKVGGISYRIRPSFILPYQRGKTQEASHGLFLLRFGVPFWALAVVFGHNSMWWYRLFLSFSNHSIVGTTIRKKESLPTDLLADEHHIKVSGSKAYVATTCGANCFLGMDVSAKADEESLKNSYQVFKEEAIDLNADYQVDTVNTDGWWATQNAWQSLFPNIQVIECFLHAFLKVRDRATKRLQVYFEQAADKIWNCYRAESKSSLAQQIRRLREWSKKWVPDSPMKENILKLCKKKRRWIQHFDYPKAHKTSNMIDRLMRAMNRHAFNSQMFHSSITSTSKNFRAFALLYNFSPSAPSTWKDTKSLKSPAARLNQSIYHEDWLQNLMIATSLGGFRNHRNPL